MSDISCYLQSETELRSYRLMRPPRVRYTVIVFVVYMNCELMRNMIAKKSKVIFS